MTALPEKQLQEHAQAIRTLGKRVVADVIEIGRRLVDAKKLCGHGNWLPWLNREFGWGETQARNFIRVYEMSKSANFVDLDLPISALYLLAAPSTPPAVRKEVLDRAASGESLSHKEVRTAVTQAKAAAVPAAQESKSSLERAIDKRAALETRIRELEAEIDRLQAELCRTLSMSAQQKVDAAIRQRDRAREATFEQRIRERVLKDTAERLAWMDENVARAEMIESLHDGVFTADEYRAIIRCLHPDSRPSAEQKAEAFRLTTDKKAVLVSETKASHLPASAADLMAQAAGCKKRTEQTDDGPDIPEALRQPNETKH
jgi:hypothetical protein